jgi:hypothetical protein
MAWISASVNPLAIRSMTVAGRFPERKSSIALMIRAWSSPARRGTGDVSRAEVGWQPEHAAAPAGGSADATTAAAIEAHPIAVARMLRMAYTIWMPWFFSGKVRMRLPVAAAYAFSTAGAATQIVGSPTPPQNPPEGMMIASTFGICAIRIES